MGTPRKAADAAKATTTRKAAPSKTAAAKKAPAKRSAGGRKAAAAPAELPAKRSRSKPTKPDTPVPSNDPATTPEVLPPTGPVLLTSVRNKVEAYIDSLDLGDDPFRAALAELAIGLAWQIDVGAGLATAAVSRELRATLSDLAGDDDGKGGDAFTEWEQSLSVPT